MDYLVMISLDLPGANDDKRKLFYEKMEKEKWKKSNLVTTTFYAKFTNWDNIDKVKLTIFNDISAAAKSASLIQWSIIVQVDSDGIYKASNNNTALIKIL